VKAKWHTSRQGNRGYWNIGESSGIQDDDIGSVALSVINVGHDPPIVFRNRSQSSDEYRFKRCAAWIIVMHLRPSGTYIMFESGPEAEFFIS
jgi:hypothetical protein